MKKSAFTLTELLVVTTIVASLACLAFPVGSQIRERGKASRDASNLRQLGVATSAFVADHNGKVFSSITEGGWPSVLKSRYVADWRTFKSLFDKRPDEAAPPNGAGVPVSYGINVNILTQSSGGDAAFDGAVAKYTSPAQLIYMAPNVDLTQSTLTFVPGTGDSNVALNVPAKAPATNSDNRGTYASRGQINVLFADYHTASMSYREYAATAGSDIGARARWQPIHTP